MKICLVSDYLVGYHKNWSGAEMVCETLADLLGKENQKTLFLTTKFGKRSNSAEICQIPILVVQGSFFKKLIMPFYLLLAIVYSTFYLWRQKPDIINFLHSNYLFIPVMAVASFLRIPTVFTFLDYYLICSRATFKMASGEICDELEGKICLRCISRLKFLEKCISRKLAKNLDGIITFTETSKQRLIRHGFKKDKIRIIYTYNIPKEFSLKLKEAKDKNILFIGSFHEHKGVRITIKGMAEVLKEVPGAKLNIIGSGNNFDTQEVNKLINDLGIKNSINFLGQKSNEEVLNLILENEIVVVPEQWPSEFGPLVLVEAMALGSEVVGSKIGSIHEFIKDGFNGFLAEHDKPEQFAEKIIWLLKNKNQAKEIRERAKEAGKILFNYSQGKETLKFYQELIKAKS